MKPAERIALAQAYVALSNAHRVDLILGMLADPVTYLSANVGRFEGGDAIGEMMTGFFARFPDVAWEIEEYRCAGDGTVAFSFAMTATDADTGESIERAGLETIAFTDEGFISRIEVANA
jgi:ketosteroid isomerase-like protein